MLCLAESAPFPTQEVSITGKGEVCGRLHNFIDSLIQFILADFVGRNVLASGMVDGHADRIDGHSHIAHFAHSDVLLPLIVFAVQGVSCFLSFLRVLGRLHSVLQSALCRYRRNRSRTSSYFSPPFL